jgi:hypothetical protein
LAFAALWAADHHDFTPLVAFLRSYARAVVEGRLRRLPLARSPEWQAQIAAVRTLSLF